MYVEYFVRVPVDARLRNCRDARALLARVHAQAEPPARFDLRLLHLEDGGQPRHAATAVRIGSHVHSLMISAVGRVAVECVLDNAPKIGALVARHYGIALQQTYRHGECDAQTATNLYTYDVPSLVLSRRNFDGDHNGITLRRILTERLLDHPLLLKLIRGALESGVQRQADLCLLDVPPWIMGDIVVHRLAPVQVKPGIYFVVGAVSFRSELHLTGPWYAGHLQSRGYGRIFSARSANTAKTA